MRAAWRFIVCSIPDSNVSQTRPATSQRSGICFSWATLRRWHRRSSDKTTRIIWDWHPLRSSVCDQQEAFRWGSGTGQGSVRSGHAVEGGEEKDSIEVGILLDEPKPSGKPDLSVIGVPDFSGLVSGSSASVGVHDPRSVIMDGGSVNRGIVPAEAQHPISTIGHDPCG